MELTDDRNGLKLQKSKRFCAIKGDNVISSIGTPLQTLGAPNTPLWIVHSDYIYSLHITICKGNSWITWGGGGNNQ